MNAIHTLTHTKTELECYALSSPLNQNILVIDALTPLLLPNMTLLTLLNNCDLGPRLTLGLFTFKTCHDMSVSQPDDKLTSSHYHGFASSWP